MSGLLDLGYGSVGKILISKRTECTKQPVFRAQCQGVERVET